MRPSPLSLSLFVQNSLPEPLDDPPNEANDVGEMEQQKAEQLLGGGGGCLATE